MSKGNESNRASIILLIGNTFLLILKLIAGLLSGSIAVLSDAFNSLTDIMASIGVYFSIKIGQRGPDATHPFGHHRAEPIAGLIIAILAGILGFEVIRYAFERLIGEPVEIQENLAMLAMGITIIVKMMMGSYFFVVGKRNNSPAIKASFVDALNDVLIGLVVIAGIVAVKFGYTYFDAIAGLFVGGIVIYSGYKVGAENIDYLMGKAADEKTVNQIVDTALKIEGVQAINDIFTHYIGNMIHVEVHIEVDPHLSTEKSHDIGKEVQIAVEHLDEISRAFVHIDPHYTRELQN
ncbi:MAG: cation diffusion facilitator family transporter [Calditrichia bacterium]